MRNQIHPLHHLLHLRRSKQYSYTIQHYVHILVIVVDGHCTSDLLLHLIVLIFYNEVLFILLVDRETYLTKEVVGDQ